MENLKIIDTHTHLPGNSFGNNPRSASELRKEFQKDGVCFAWLFTTDGLIKDCTKHNDILSNQIKDLQDFFCGFCTINPHEGLAACINEMKRAKEKLNLKGIKLHPWLQAFSVTQPLLVDLLKAAGDLEMPVIFHDGTPPYSEPLQIAYAAQRAPETKVILGHSGLDFMYQDAIAACNDLENVYLCLCSLSTGYIEKVLNSVPAAKLLFGSDGGFAPGLVRWAVQKIMRLDPPKSIHERIFWKNAALILPI